MQCEGGSTGACHCTMPFPRVVAPPRRFDGRSRIAVVDPPIARPKRESHARNPWLLAGQHPTNAPQAVLCSRYRALALAAPVSACIAARSETWARAASHCRIADASRPIKHAPWHRHQVDGPSRLRRYIKTSLSASSSRAACRRDAHATGYMLLRAPLQLVSEASDCSMLRGFT